MALAYARSDVAWKISSYHDYHERSVRARDPTTRDVRRQITFSRWTRPGQFSSVRAGALTGELISFRSLGPRRPEIDGSCCRLVQEKRPDWHALFFESCDEYNEWIGSRVCEQFAQNATRNTRHCENIYLNLNRLRYLMWIKILSLSWFLFLLAEYIVNIHFIDKVKIEQCTNKRATNKDAR